MVNLFIYGPFMKGYMNQKYQKGYPCDKTSIHGYRRSWLRSENSAILVKDFTKIILEYHSS